MVHRDVKEVRKFMIEHSKVTLVLKGLTLGTLQVVQWLRLHSQCWGPRFDPSLGNWIPHIVTKSSHAATKTPHSQIHTYFYQGNHFMSASKVENALLFDCV